MFQMNPNITYQLVNGSTIVVVDGKDGKILGRSDPLSGYVWPPVARQSWWPNRVTGFSVPHPAKEALDWSKIYNRSYETLNEMRKPVCQKTKLQKSVAPMWSEISVNTLNRWTNEN